MGKRWAAAAVLTAALLWGISASPLADAGEGAVLEREAVPAAEPERVLVPPETPVSQLELLRAVPVEGVPEEARDAACYAVFRGLLGEGDFDGAAPVSRSEAAAALRALGGSSDEAEEVPEELRDGVSWTEETGGKAEMCFAPGGPVTRRELAEMLYSFALWQGRGDFEAGASGEERGGEEALDWVLESGLYQGLTEQGLYPNLPVSRLQLAEVLVRLERDRDPLAAELSLPEGGEMSLSRREHEAVSGAVDEAARRYGAVGVQVAVVEKGAVTDVYHWGWAVKDSVPMTSRHKMRTASLSKVAVGLSAALLREEGAVDYDADIGVYWGKDARNPRCPEEPVTIRTMLNHTSTLRNSEEIAWDYAGVREQLGSPAGYGGGTPGDLENWSYNNHAFGILGQTLELAAGRYLDDVLKERLLTPLDADGSFAAGDLEEPELITPLYRISSVGRSASSLRSIHQWSAPGATGRQFAGGFTSNAEDLAKLTAVLAGDGCFQGVRLMEAASVELMESHDAQALPDGSWQALPMRLRQNLYGRERLYYHTGSAYGVYHLLSYDPDTGDGVVVLTMGASGEKDGHGIYAVCGEISEAVYGAIG